MSENTVKIKCPRCADFEKRYGKSIAIRCYECERLQREAQRKAASE